MCVLHALQRSHDLSAKMRWHTSPLSIVAISGTKGFVLCAWSHNLRQLLLSHSSQTSVLADERWGHDCQIRSEVRMQKRNDETAASSPEAHPSLRVRLASMPCM